MCATVRRCNGCFTDERLKKNVQIANCKWAKDFRETEDVSFTFQDFICNLQFEYLQLPCRELFFQAEHFHIQSQ